ncbi:ELOV7-like protein [Mya arenaria]|uniref:Elongation of very long chain fatty acids protein n=2 Tax=Mya arenaria TaxID=6604 RepID=A0ABY7FTV7_MYAAR|nr:ELOV7-like protein [Mya arenaria]WAR24156.1 ELOV7-like protein [Mya arenaria]
MMSSPIPSFLICMLYVVIIKLGPWLMKDREPFCLRKILLVYNFAMVFLSTFCFLEYGLSGWFTGYSLGCQEVDYSNSPKALRMANVCWWFYFSKFIELLDTIFFVLRKKFNQCTFLHVFHHAIMPVSWWFGVRFVAGGFGTFHAMLNSFIHMVMYFYYFLSALGPKYQKYLWWKRYMTKMQIIQFLVVTIHSVQLLWMKNCNYPTVFVYWILSYALIFLIMFGNFYVQAYRKSHKDSHTGNGSTVTNGKQKKH